MATRISDQIEALERELSVTGENRLSYAVREALEAQLTALRKKQTSKDGKRATIGDGTYVTKGAFVFEAPRYYGGRNRSELPKIARRKVCNVSSDGKQVCVSQCFSGKHYYYEASTFYSTPDGAFNKSLEYADNAILSSLREIEKVQKDHESDVAYKALLLTVTDASKLVS